MAFVKLVCRKIFAWCRRISQKEVFYIHIILMRIKALHVLRQCMPFNREGEHMIVTERALHRSLCA